MSSLDNGELAAFLQARRERITPQQAGLTLYGDRRRVAGLRREELAMLAGVSSSYYTRLEQGGSRNASRQVLDALATALQLNDAERAHLIRWGTSTRSRTGTCKPPVDHADPALLELLTAIGDVPALIMGRRSDVLAWNALGHALLAPHLDIAAPLTPASRPNMASMVFLDTETRVLYCDWPAKSRAVVGNLRLIAGKHPEDPLLAQLVGSLAVVSPEFAALWADHRVQPCATAVYELAHPLIGKLALTQQTLRSVEHPDQTLVTHTATTHGAATRGEATTTAAKGSSAREELASREALLLLAQLVGTAQSDASNASRSVAR